MILVECAVLDFLAYKKLEYPGYRGEGGDHAGRGIYTIR